MAFCSNCGNELKDGAKFCPKCGTRINIAPVPIENSRVDDEEEEEEYEEYEELSIGLKILIFLFWPLGFSVYHSNWENQPYKAHSAILWAGYGIVADIVAYFIVFNFL